MRLNFTLQDETGKLEAVVFGALAEKLSGYQPTSSLISEGVQNDRLPEELKAIINEEYMFTVRFTDQACDQLLLKYKVFAFLLKTTDPAKESTLKGKEIMGSTGESERPEDDAVLTSLSPTSYAIPKDLFPDESPAKRMKTSVTRKILHV